MWAINIVAREQHADSIGTTFSRPRGRCVSKSSMALHERVSEHGGAAKLPLDLEKTIVLGNPLASTKRACLHLPTGHGYREVGYERVFGLPRSMQDDITPSHLLAQLERGNRFGGRTDLVERGQCRAGLAGPHAASRCRIGSSATTNIAVNSRPKCISCGRGPHPAMASRPTVVSSTALGWRMPSSRVRFKSSALTATRAELPDIARAATAGLIRKG